MVYSNESLITVLNNIVRIGTVSSVDVEKRLARVSFHDKQGDSGDPFVSGWLNVLQNQPLIAFKKWVEDKSIPGHEPDEIKKIIIVEEENPNFQGIYHSVNRKLGIGEKYAKGEIADIRESKEVHTTNEPDYIKESDYFKDGEKTLIEVYPWLPYIDQIVLCIYLPNGESDGFVIGGI